MPRAKPSREDLDFYLKPIYEQGRTVKEMVEQEGACAATIYRWMRQYGFAYRHLRHTKGKSCPRCGYSVLSRAGFVKGKQRFSCRKCCHFFQEGNVKWNRRPPRAIPDQVKEALQYHQNGATVKQISEWLGVSRNTIYWWLKKWRI